MTISIIFPNQIFENSKLLDESNEVYLIEEYLFFNLSIVNCIGVRGFLIS